MNPFQKVKILWPPRRWRSTHRKGQAVMEYLTLLFFVVGVAAAIMVFVVPIFRNQFMRRLMSIVVQPYVQ